MTESDQGEYTLGIGKLLGLFFLVAVLCALSFAVGYTYGRASSKQPAPGPESQPAAASAPVKPAPKTVVVEPSAANCPEGKNCQPPGIPSSQDLSFYNSVKKKGAAAPLSAPKASQPQPPPAAPQTAKVTPPPPPAKAPEPAPAKARPAASPVLSGVMVQVAAVSKREDAEALQQALRRKQYPVVITTATSDRLFHVQVGPFNDPKEAETTRARLQGEGYNPILKK